MATQGQVTTWLNYLTGTTHFESVFRTVLLRVLKGEGHGVMILQGTFEIGNKSFFLNIVKAFQKGAPPQAKYDFPPELQRLLAEVEASNYQCVDMKEDYPVRIVQPVSDPVVPDLAACSLLRVAQERVEKGTQNGASVRQSPGVSASRTSQNRYCSFNNWQP